MFATTSIFALTLAIASFISPARAAPVAEDVKLVARDGTDPPGAICTYNDNGFWNSYVLYIPEKMFDESSCGQGLLDNLGGQCGHGSITNWQCRPNGEGTDFFFNTAKVLHGDECCALMS
ncbi:hypothetical protein LTR66_000594 [Elasticomyces elasticus]|nr:hypothetical protein LTR66_000594 [Elasticomyces elasticus]